jgi:hypothetical protein
MGFFVWNSRSLLARYPHKAYHPAGRVWLPLLIERRILGIGLVLSRMVKVKGKNIQFRWSDRRIQFRTGSGARGGGQMEIPDIERKSRKAIWMSGNCPSSVVKVKSWIVRLGAAPLGEWIHSIWEGKWVLGHWCVNRWVNDILLKIKHNIWWIAFSIKFSNIERKVICVDCLHKQSISDALVLKFQVSKAVHVFV